MSQSKVEILNFNSNILGKEMKVFVYLPEGYDNLTPLPVLYFLHGRSGNENIMFELDIKSKADKMIKNREINPMIIVCPRMENSRGLNSSLICKEVINIKDNRVINLGMYEDYFMKEIIPLIDKSFNTINDRKQRFIGERLLGVI
ncbi:esterase [[Clostridium] sordellii]|uniref:Esterase family protein n=1 Tax=Paraclostridium sordellii TaxID=1505 RepID=A0ABM9RM39_PARSO|nr:alpha/beta hydrolase-fold protein [Paeniclostridium sordellii]EPZ58848.1 esterase family protein [[Clostridium] sordellii ATCC 9714] [Paeniclostridium sordellii ATCC 9714]CEJ73084.1 hypothetical protein ATCC9714_09721 [[Clostridium] sordellii] [Paeniclostridium sordellii]CEN68637.1 esterase [[Clostridium] sordellii] [Paeniclostridium sordellii]CEN71904.1 esterase [[Clostridium] sordellii] [Paeniclostridium sordellii]CEO22667.1 esterase [[Clostridium] sordellii] [Paeniclostridium sordellii]